MALARNKSHRTRHPFDAAADRIRFHRKTTLSERDIVHRRSRRDATSTPRVVGMAVAELLRSLRRLTTRMTIGIDEPDDGGDIRIALSTPDASHPRQIARPSDVGVMVGFSVWWRWLRR
jgi:hypothetical protein